MAEAAPPFGPVIDPDDERFLRPGDLPRAIAEACRETGQAAVTEPGAVVRCTLESLALRYRWTLARLEAVTGLTDAVAIGLQRQTDERADIRIVVDNEDLGHDRSIGR